MEKESLAEITDKIMETKNPEKFLENEDVSILGVGKTRVCISVDIEKSEYNQEWVKTGVCAKLPYTKHGFMQNSLECHNWNSEMLNFKKFLLPILEYHEDFKYVIMPEGTPLDKMKEIEEDYEEFRDNIRKLTKIKSLDLNRENCVFYDGRIYLSDYGMLHKLE